MNRLTLTLVVLAATGGCALDRDALIERDSARWAMPQSWETPQGYRRSSDGRLVQEAGSPSLHPANGMSLSTVAESGTNTTGGKMVAESAAKSAPKKASDSTSTAPAKATTTAKTKPETVKTVDAKTTADATPKTIETKSASADLGVLRLFSTKRVAFHYEVKDTGTLGAPAVELWGTQDMRHWKKYETLARTSRSFAVDVKDEGLYGFTIIARDKADPMKDRPPQPGAPPQVWVAVDVTKPVVHLLGAELNLTSRSPTLVVRWSAKDKSFGPRPIALLYSEHLEGPWVSLASNIENSGQYEWTMPKSVPPNVYVRVQAADLMGNTGMAQTSLLHLPGGTALSSGRAELSPRSALPSPLETVRPVAATVPAPAVSIVSVDSE